ncbi:MAG: terminase large subunit [Magnetococcus sp. WYHC-3]
MALTLAQTQIAKDKHRFRVICCGRRFGKTTLAVKEIVGKIAAGKLRIAYIAPTYQQARDICWEMLKKVFDGADFNESRLEIRIGEQLVQLRGWESIETLRGQKFDFIVIDEIAMMRNFWENWQEVIRPTLTDTRGHVMFISTPKGFNHFYDLYNLQDTDKDYKSFHFTSYDNPFIPIEELDKAREELTEDRFAQEYLADFRKTEGLVYKEFSRDRHIETPLNLRKAKTILGIDFGYTNPACILKIDIDYDNHYWITEEWYKTNQTNDQIVQKALSFKPQEVYPDPAEPDRIQELNRAGLNVREVSKDIANGISRVRELFKQNRIHIHPDCKNLIWELETYSYPDRKPDHNEEEKPIKENDHAVDALRYALYTISPVRPAFKKPTPRPQFEGVKLRMTNY